MGTIENQELGMKYFKLGDQCHVHGNYDEAEKYMLLAAENGIVNAMYNLGVLYGTQGRFSEAEKYYLQAVNKGYVAAMSNIGILWKCNEII